MRINKKILLTILSGFIFIGQVFGQVVEQNSDEQHRQAACDEYWNGLASNINKHKKYKDREEYLQAVKSQLLHDNNDGTVLLNEFASEYLPNTYSKYEKAREKSLEVEQNLNTIFIGEIDDRSPNWISYLTATEKYSKILVDELRIQNGISHIYFLHKVGALTDEKLAEFDNTEKMNFVHENFIVHSLVDNIVKKDNVIEFAQKNMPETFALLETFEKEQNLTKRMFEDIMSDAQKLNYLKINSTHIVFLLVEYKYRELTNNYNLLMQEINDYQTKYLLLEITGGELATVDGNIGARYRKFSKNLPEYVKKGVLRRNCKFSTIDSILMSMVQIPSKDYLLSKFEVTQAQWYKIMENNPSSFSGWNLPVDNVTWNDSLEFIEKLNSLPEVKKSGLVFRLPTQEEWEYAFFSDKTAKDYRYTSREEVQQTGWNWENSGGKTHPVGQKKPNPFGLYDMYGNAGEWLDSKDQFGDVYFVAWNYAAWGLNNLTLYSKPNGEYGHFREYKPGFRLAASRAEK